MRKTRDPCSYYKYWGKADPADADGEQAYHLLPYHCLDVAAVGRVLLSRHSSWGTNWSSRLGLNQDLFSGLAVLFLALHDVGKFSAAFQGILPDIYRSLTEELLSRNNDLRHDSLGLVLWRDSLAGEVLEELIHPEDLSIKEKARWRGSLELWFYTATGHHGRPPKIRRSPAARFFALPRDGDAVATFLYDFLEILEIDLRNPALPPAEELLNNLPQLSWRLAGFSVLCDWLGSNTDYFPFHSDPINLRKYWFETALPSAEKIVLETAILPRKPAKLTGIREMFGFIERPTPLQEKIESLEIGEGPQLFILEDLTGSGKTEAAFVLVHRLMEKGLGDGAFIALPSMATANAMFERTGSVYRKLFQEEESPSLVLAHGSRHLNAGYRDSILPKHVALSQTLEGELPAGAQCNAWLADNRKKALLAHIGVGTIDQTLLAILNVRHQSLRLLGLQGKILVVDEVHACDSYMHRLLETLLSFHAASGGCAILLSATLPRQTRLKLIEAFNSSAALSHDSAAQAHYPLVTHVLREEVREVPVEVRSGSGRELSFSSVRDVGAAEKWIREQVEQGRCVCWVRNTVADAQRAFESLKQALPENRLILFHARFVLGHRLTIEEDVVRRFGKKSGPRERRGMVVVATQVVEQSLDIDFDEMITDLAPFDLLLQRAGRMRRHNRTREGTITDGPDRRGATVLHVLSPPPSDAADADWLKDTIPGTAWVYPHIGHLWLTMDLIEKKKSLHLLREIREAIDGIYDSEAQERVPSGLQPKSIEAEAQSLVGSSLARMNACSLTGGYRPPSAEWEEDIHAMTRLGEPTATLRLARWDGEELKPFHEGGAHAWAESEISVRRSRVAEEDWPGEVKKAARELKESWGRASNWILLIPMQEGTVNWTGRARDPEGRPVTLDYYPLQGLTIENGR